MAKFVLFIREDLSKYPIPEEKLQSLINAHRNWASRLSKTGKFIDGNGIAPEGNLVEKVNEVIQISPLRDVREGLGGFYILDVADMDEAITIAKGCPTFDEGDIIEVRALM